MSEHISFLVRIYWLFTPSAMATTPVPGTVTHSQLCLVAKHSCTLCVVPRPTAACAVKSSPSIMYLFMTSGTTRGNFEWKARGCGKQNQTLDVDFDDKCDGPHPCPA